MRTRTKLIMALALLPLATIAQDKYYTKQGVMDFRSEAPMEKIEARNSKVACVVDMATGAVEASALMKAFEFEKALMQEHFNENYVESDKFPKATFKGTIKGLDAAVLSDPGQREFKATGELTVHGVAKALEVPITFTTAKDGSVKAECKFQVHPEDHDIKIPEMVRDNIAKVVDVRLQVDLQKL